MIDMTTPPTKAMDLHIEDTPTAKTEHPGDHHVPDIEKLKATRADVALNIFDDAHDVAQEIDPAVERRLIRKIDWCIIPLICFTYLFTFIDKTTLSYGM